METLSLLFNSNDIFVVDMVSEFYVLYFLSHCPDSFPLFCVRGRSRETQFGTFHVS